MVVVGVHGGCCGSGIGDAGIYPHLHYGIEEGRT